MAHRRSPCIYARDSRPLLQFSTLWSCFFKTRRNAEDTWSFQDSREWRDNGRSFRPLGTLARYANTVHTFKCRYTRPLCVHIAPARLSTLLLSSEQPLSSIVLQTVPTRGSNVRHHCIYLLLSFPNTYTNDYPSTKYTRTTWLCIYTPRNHFCRKNCFLTKSNRCCNWCKYR